MSADLLKFYKGRHKKPELHQYTADGNLQILKRDGTVDKVIELVAYRPPTAEELAEVEQTRQTAIAEAQAKFETSREVLRATVATNKATPSEIIALNRAITDADNALQVVRFPLREVIVYDSIDTNLILLDQPNEKRKMFDVVSFISRPMTLQDNYARTGVAAPVEQAETRVIRKKRKRTPVIFFKLPDTNEFGFLTMEWPVDFDFNSIRYRSAKHALLGELAKEFNDTAMFTRIQATEDPAAIAYTYEDTPGTTEEAWNMKRNTLIQQITREKFIQHPELAEQLIQTGEATLAADVIDDTLFGIGLSMDDSKALRPKSWTGQNLLGKTLQAIRNELKDARLVAEETAVMQSRNGLSVTGITNAVTNAVTGATDAVTSAVTSAAGAATNAVTSAAGAATNAVTSAVTGATDAVTSAVTSATGAVTNTVGGAVQDPLKKRTLRLLR